MKLAEMSIQSHSLQVGTIIKHDNYCKDTQVYKSKKMQLKGLLPRFLKKFFPLLFESVE